MNYSVVRRYDHDDYIIIVMMMVMMMVTIIGINGDDDRDVNDDDNVMCTHAFIVCALQRTSDDKQLSHHNRLSVESYLDVIERIRPVIIELERQKRSIVIVCHIAIIR